MGSGDDLPQISVLSDDLVAHLKAVFYHPNYATDATDRLLSIQHGARSVAENTVEFWTLAVEAGWNESLLMGFFRWGLNIVVALRGHPNDLDSLISLATELDTCLSGQHRDQATLSSAISTWWRLGQRWSCPPTPLLPPWMMSEGLVRWTW